MPRFLYRAKKGPREQVSGSIEAENKNAALHKLTSMGYFPISIEQEDVEKSTVRTKLLSLFKKVAIRDLSVFTRQLSDLLEAGLPLVRALSVLQRQTENRYLQSIITDIKEFVRDGNSLSSALERHTRIFSNLYVSMVRSGETAGNLENVLLRLAEYQESQEELNTKVHSAMAYPALMGTVGLVTIFVLITFVIPKIVAMFEELNQALPLPTIILLNISNFIRKFWVILTGGILLIYLAFKRFVNTPEGKFAADRVKLTFPIMGQLILRSEISRFSRTLSTLLNNGVPILEALSIVIAVMGNDSLKKDVKTAQREGREGASLAKGLGKGSYFPVFVNNMIAIGEESGALEKALLKVAVSYEKEVDKTVRIMTSLLEPVMILTMGLILGFIVIAMLLPIFEISFIEM